MKKFLLFMMVLIPSIILSSCSRKDDGTGPEEKDFLYIRVIVKNADGSTPQGGKAAIFFHDSAELDRFGWISGKTGDMFYATNKSNGEHIFPITKIGGDDLVDLSNGLAKSFFKSSFSSRYGEPTNGGKYYVCIKTFNGDVISKSFTINHNCDITATITKRTDVFGEDTATWEKKDAN